MPLHQWLMAFHIIGVVMWFAGLFYLPRLFVYHAEAGEPIVRSRFQVMERRLLVMTHIGAAWTIALGLATLATEPGLIHAHWLQVKLVLVLALVIYHGALVKLTRDFAGGRCRWTSRGLRWFNEVPTVLLLAIVILAVVKPF